MAPEHGAAKLFPPVPISLAELESRFLSGLNESFKWEAGNITAELWLGVFRQEFGMAADPDDIEDFGPEGCVEDFRERYPDRAEDIELIYLKALEDAQVRVAWGLATHDYRKIRAFVECRISHPAIGTREMGRSGLEAACGARLDEMRKCLRDAEMLALDRLKNRGFANGKD